MFKSKRLVFFNNKLAEYFQKNLHIQKILYQNNNDSDSNEYVDNFDLHFNMNNLNDDIYNHYKLNVTSPSYNIGNIIKINKMHMNVDVAKGMIVDTLSSTILEGSNKLYDIAVRFLLQSLNVEKIEPLQPKYVEMIDITKKHSLCEDGQRLFIYMRCYAKRYNFIVRVYNIHNVIPSKLSNSVYGMDVDNNTYVDLIGLKIILSDFCDYETRNVCYNFFVPYKNIFTVNVFDPLILNKIRMLLNSTSYEVYYKQVYGDYYILIHKIMLELKYNFPNVTYETIMKGKEDMSTSITFSDNAIILKCINERIHILSLDISMWTFHKNKSFAISMSSYYKIMEEIYIILGNRKKIIKYINTNSSNYNLHKLLSSMMKTNNNMIHDDIGNYNDIVIGHENNYKKHEILCCDKYENMFMTVYMLHNKIYSPSFLNILPFYHDFNELNCTIITWPVNITALARLIALRKIEKKLPPMYGFQYILTETCDSFNVSIYIFEIDLNDIKVKINTREYYTEDTFINNFINEINNIPYSHNSTTEKIIEMTSPIKYTRIYIGERISNYDEICTLIKTPMAFLSI
jgi:hypothetical protein